MIAVLLALALLVGGGPCRPAYRWVQHPTLPLAYLYDSPTHLRGIYRYAEGRYYPYVYARPMGRFLDCPTTPPRDAPAVPTREVSDE